MIYFDLGIKDLQGSQKSQTNSQTSLSAGGGSEINLIYVGQRATAFFANLPQIVYKILRMKPKIFFLEAN